MKTSASKLIKYLVLGLFLVLMAIANNQAYAANKITFYHYDLLGSPVATTNELGEVVWREEYSPYGDKLLKQDVGKDNVRGYTGHVHDEETGLTYMQARYYDPEIGRFMGVDPVGFKSKNPITFNRYAYAGDNPYKYTDPNGEYFGYAFPSDYFSSGKFYTDFAFGFAEASVEMAPGMGVADGVNDIRNGEYALGIIGVLSEIPLAKPLKATRLRHFTNKKGIEGIKDTEVIKASDQDRVFTVKAKGKPKSPRDVEEELGISRGRGNNYVEFDAYEGEFAVVKNPQTGATEYTLKGDVDLKDRNASFSNNR